MNADEIIRELFSPEGRANPYPHYTALHALGGAASVTPGVAGPFGAVVHGYDAVDQVLRDPGFLVSDSRHLDLGSTTWRGHPTLTTLMTTMMFTNAPDHGRMRKLFHQVLTVRRVNALEPMIARIVDALMDRMAATAADGGEVDFISQFAYLMPTSVVGGLLGIPDADLDWFRPRVQQIVDYLDQTAKSPEVLLATDAVTREILDYYRAMIADRRARPREDFVSTLVQVLDAEHHQLSEDEVVANLVLMFNAGFVTTINMLGNGLPILLERPVLAKSVCDDTQLLTDTVDEIIRYDASLQYISRWVADDREIAGVRVPAGSMVLVLLGAANRDPGRYRDPDLFDVTRPRLQSLSFGAGPHYCLGAALSRLEGQLAFPMLLRRFPDLAVGAAERNDQLLLRGYRRLPVDLGEVKS
ncbi:cytochrome P450 [Catellatospora sp. KI3]|uniref:cytochrome P450 n=1 Tax=Catellatospora sp. KI3 TaxID=3041620 RepID=UPI002482850C|nr:cytochrome P450 [Catellatospora sp. KI3]MDI1461129.1 cytochrome P450 [Catellatospora sp. KI3]